MDRPIRAFIHAGSATLAINVAQVFQGWERLPGQRLKWVDQDGRHVVLLNGIRDLFGLPEGLRIYLGPSWEDSQSVAAGDFRRIAKARRLKLVEIGPEPLKPSNPVETQS